MSCPPGQIKRSSYKRSNSSKVHAACIKDQGKPGKGQKLFDITKPNLLRNYGYKLDKSSTERKTSLKRAMSHEKPLEVLKHLNAIRTVNKSRPKIYSKFDSDMKFVQKEYKKVSKKVSKK